MGKYIYSITLTNFNKYNGSIKKGHKATLISNRFCNDAKILSLPIHTRWLFLNLVLTCGDLSRDTVELSEEQLRNMLETRQNIPTVLDLLQSLQLLTWHKNALFLNRIEKKRREEKETEVSNETVVSESKSFNEKKEAPKKIEPYEVLIEIWNMNRGQMREALAWNENRTKQAKKRWRDFPDPKFWTEVVMRLAQSSFCTGDNDRGWKADFDFLLRPNTHLAVNEGKYDNKKQRTNDVLGVIGA